MKSKRKTAARRVLPLALLPWALIAPAHAQSTKEATDLPAVVVTAPEQRSLTVPSAGAAREEIRQTPGAVDVVPAEQWEKTEARTLKDVLDFTPGVFAQPKWGEDTRLSIRGSGLSRNFHMRGIHMYQDGVPVNQSDGSSDFQEIDPTAFAYTEVYKGGNALRYGANSLGGAINLVSPTGHDASPFAGTIGLGTENHRVLQASTGGVKGDVDGFFTVSSLDRDGFRDHSGGDSIRAAANAGWRINADAETRFYVNVADIQQDIPGSLTKDAALTTPRTANATNIRQHYQRNIESYRLANKTTLRFGPTTLEAGGYAVSKHLIHPIFQVLDYHYYDFGGFGRIVDERDIAGHENRLTVGVTVSGGWVDNTMYTNNNGHKGGLRSQSKDRSLNTVAYLDNSFDVTPDVSLIGGLQAVRAVRKRVDEYPDNSDTSGRNVYTFVNPKVGAIWRAGRTWEVFGNVSQSGEAPTFSELNFTNTVLSDTEAQHATTFEIGTRGEHAGISWDVAFYRSWIENEFQYFDLGGGNYSVTNADETIHQGIEAGIAFDVAEGIYRRGANPDSIRFKAAYTFSDFRFDDDASWGDNELPGAPRHFIRMEALYQSPDGYFAGPNVEWVPEAYYVDNANTFETNGYALLGFRAGFDATEQVSFFVDARNLTDEKYIASASVAATANANSALFEPGDGRSVFAGMKLKW